MAKKIIIAFVILAGIGAALFFAFRELEQEAVPPSGTLSAIPPDAAIIYETRDPHGIWSKLTQSNVMWAGLKEVPFYKETNDFGTRLDSLMMNNAQLKSMFDKQSMVVSVHMSGAGKFNALLVTAVPEQIDKATFETLINEMGEGEAILSERQYDGSDITDITYQGDDTKYSFSIKNGLLLLSPSGVLVEDAVRHLNSGESLINTPEFTKVQSTAGVNDVDGNLYINYQEFPKLLGIYLNMSTIKQALPLVNFADWSEMDVRIETNGLTMEGFTYSGDSLMNYLNLFSNQETQDVVFHDIAPTNTALLLEIGISDHAQWRRDYMKHLEKKGQRHRYDDKLAELSAECGCDPEAGILSWLGENMALLITEPSSDDPTNNTYALFNPNDAVEARSAIETMISSSAATKGVSPEVETFEGHTLKRVHVSQPFYQILGSLFNDIETPWFTMIDDMVVFANSAAALRDLVRLNIKDQTLGNDVNYLNFVENLSDESNIYLYSSIARSPNLYKSYLAEEHAAAIDTNLAVFREFEAACFQLSHYKNSLYLNQFKLKYNPVYKQVTTSLWETELDTITTGKHWLVKNHYTNTDEVLVQDAANTLYLVSTTGSVLWKRQLAEPIMGDVQQIDIYKNDKLQLIFNTASNVYVLDRNGKDVTGWPVSLMAPATNQLTVLDYDKNHEYRIVVPAADNKIYNFDKLGKAVEGWKFAGSGSPIRKNIQHFVVKNKDYVLAAEQSGKIHLLDRRGGERVNSTAKLDAPSRNNPIYVDKGNAISSTRLIYSDTIGVVVLTSIDGNVERIPFETRNPGHHFRWRDLNGDRRKEFIFADGNQLTVYDHNRNLLFQKEYSGRISAPEFLTLNDGSALISVSVAESNEVVVINGLGDELPAMPLFGAQTPRLKDINNDGAINLITSTPEGKIFTYSVK